jgi:hypothetical protein
VKLLRLPATFTTPEGRAQAEARAAFLLAFAERLSRELGVPARPWP